MIAGHHSTVSGLSSLLMHVITRSGLRAAIADDPKVLDRAIEEAVRLNTPLHQFRRVTTEEVQCDGIAIPAGSNVLVNYAAANRDPSHFDRPDEFDVDRPSGTHLGFGHGIHYCVGAPLARTELRIATTKLLERLPDVTVTARPAHEFHGQLSMIEHLHATFSPVAPH